MKIRTDFVTNSSSASFIIRLYIETENKTYQIAYGEMQYYEDIGLEGTILDSKDGYNQIIKELEKGRTHFLGEKVIRVILEDFADVDGEFESSFDDRVRQFLNINKLGYDMDSKTKEIIEMKIRILMLILVKLFDLQVPLVRHQVELNHLSNLVLKIL